MSNRIILSASILAMLAILLISDSVWAGIYRWKGVDGKLHFGDKPPPDATEVIPFQGGGSVSFIGDQSASRQRSKANVRMFMTQSCGYCKRAKAYLNAKGISFEELDIERSSSAKLEYQQLGGRGVPVILVGMERMNGYNQESLEALLKQAGY